MPLGSVISVACKSIFGQVQDSFQALVLCVSSGPKYKCFLFLHPFVGLILSL